MACNCATTEQINELYRRYGTEKNKKTLSFKLKVKNLLKKIGIGICIILLFPFLAIYVYYKAFCSEDRRIDVTKFFNLDKEKRLETNVGY